MADGKGVTSWVSRERKSRSEGCKRLVPFQLMSATAATAGLPIRGTAVDTVYRSGAAVCSVPRYLPICSPVLTRRLCLAVVLLDSEIVSSPSTSTVYSVTANKQTVDVLF